jgi:hypothetical protein
LYTQQFCAILSIRNEYWDSTLLLSLYQAREGKGGLTMSNIIKYYAYISDTKVDMLYPQIPPPLLNGIAAELKIDLKLFGTGFGATFKGNQSEETRYSKLRIVEKYIEKHLDVGTIEAPKSYFRGTLSMLWGPFPGDRPEIVYFGGFTGNTVLGLGGSLHHIIGSKGDPLDSYISGGSDGGKILDALSSAESWPLPFPSFDQSYWHQGRTALNVIANIESELGMRRLKQNVEFLAKSLYRGELDRHPLWSYALLGTPIYVSLV